MKFPENITDEQVDKARKIFMDELIPPTFCDADNDDNDDEILSAIQGHDDARSIDYQLGYISSELILMLEDDSLLQRNRKRYEEILQAVVDGEVSQ